MGISISGNLPKKLNSYKNIPIPEIFHRIKCEYSSCIF